MPGEWSVTRAHDVADAVEAAVAAALDDVDVTTHVEPAGYDHGACGD